MPETLFNVLIHELLINSHYYLNLYIIQSTNFMLERGAPAPAPTTWPGLPDSDTAPHEEEDGHGSS